MTVNFSVQKSRNNPSQKTEFEQTKTLFRQTDIREAAPFRLQSPGPETGASTKFERKNHKEPVPESNPIIM